jgi:hypothetical protein
MRATVHVRRPAPADEWTVRDGSGGEAVDDDRELVGATVVGERAGEARGAAGPSFAIAA